MKTVLFTTVLGSMLVLGGVRGMCEPVELDQRTKCVALIKEVLAYAKCRDATAVFGKIMDGVGAQRVRLFAPAEGDKFVVQQGGRDKFFEKNFPGVLGMLERFDRIKFSEVRSEGEVRVDHGTDAGQNSGKLFVMDVVLPEESGVDLQKQGSDGYRVYSRVRFVEHNGRLYWIPFGW